MGLAERLAEKASRPRELVATGPNDRDWKRHRRGGTTGFLIMEDAGPNCMTCAGLGGLVFLPAGDAKLTRRVKAKSARTAVVARFSRDRKRYERQGLLVEEAALREPEGGRRVGASRVRVDGELHRSGFWRINKVLSV